eukprot:2124779-Rhodomonas_salina.2
MMTAWGTRVPRVRVLAWKLVYWQRSQSHWQRPSELVSTRVAGELARGKSGWELDRAARYQVTRYARGAAVPRRAGYPRTQVLRGTRGTAYRRAGYA